MVEKKRFGSIKRSNGELGIGLGCRGGVLDVSKKQKWKNERGKERTRSNLEKSKEKMTRWKEWRGAEHNDALMRGNSRSCCQISHAV